MKRKCLSRKLSLLLIAVFAVTFVAAGCGGGNPTDSTATTAASAAASTAPALEPVELKWYVPGFKASVTEEGLKAVLNEVNETIKEKINATLNLVLIDYSEYVQKMQLIDATGESYDMCFTSYWFNNYKSNVNKGAYTPLNDQIRKYGGNLLEQCPKEVLDSVKIKGKIYAMPSKGIYTAPQGFYGLKDLADKYGFNPQGVVKIEDIEEFFDKIKTGEPGIYPFSGVNDWLAFMIVYGFEPGGVAGDTIPGTIRIVDKDLKVINQYEAPEFKNFCETMRRWNEKGYMRKDLLAYKLNPDNKSKDIRNGKFAVFQSAMVSPADDAEAKIAAGGREVIGLPLAAKHYTSAAGEYAATAVSTNSKNADRAVMLFDLMYSDVKLYNTLLYGVEGKNYAKVSENVVERIPNSGYGNETTPIGDFAIGNIFNGWVIKGEDPELWKKMSDFSKDATPSYLVGFSFDPADVQTEIANCTAIFNEYIKQFETGSVDVDKKLPEFIDKLKKAGSGKIITEAQKQIDQWKKDSGK